MCRSVKAGMLIPLIQPSLVVRVRGSDTFPLFHVGLADDLGHVGRPVWQLHLVGAHDPPRCAGVYPEADNIEPRTERNRSAMRPLPVLVHRIGAIVIGANLEDGSLGFHGRLWMKGPEDLIGS